MMLEIAVRGLPGNIAAGKSAARQAAPGSVGRSRDGTRRQQKM
jgi:hypothetical protein